MRLKQTNKQNKQSKQTNKANKQTNKQTNIIIFIFTEVRVNRGVPEISSTAAPDEVDGGGGVWLHGGGGARRGLPQR